MIKILLVAIAITATSAPALAGLLDIYKLDDGHTNWQYVANTSGTLLILALSYTLFRLVESIREAKRYNNELELTRSQLEERVKERTATLDESNRLLQHSNEVLEAEIGEHKSTSERLKASESYINSILHSMPLMLIGLNDKSQITQWNRKAEEASGLAAHDVIGKRLWTAYPSITITPYQIERARRDKESVTLKQSQRGDYHFDVTIYPLEQDSETDVVILVDDVTQRVMTENMLIQRDKMSAMGELAGTLAQDISTPLQAMLMDVQEIQSRIDPVPFSKEQDPRALLSDALSRGQQASDVITNLLAFSTAHTGQMQPASVVDILEHSVELASKVITVPSGLTFGDIRLERDYEDNLPQVPCHAAELQQVFLSLLRHCCQALGELEDDNRQRVITLQVNQFYEALWIKIQHNGRGISLEQQQNLFEPFHSETGEISAEDYDAGKRLSYPYFIITEQHRGHMAVTSDVDVGTTFHLQLRLD